MSATATAAETMLTTTATSLIVASPEEAGPETAEVEAGARGARGLPLQSTSILPGKHVMLPQLENTSAVLISSQLEKRRPC